MSATSTSPTTARRRAAAWLPWAVPVTLLAAWVIHVLRNYEIRAFSDPLNWLHFASQFGAEIHTSKFALGFPIFLRAALELVGPFRIFLVNLPVLAAVYLMAGSLAARAFGPENRVPRWQVVATVLALFFSFDRWLVVQMVNPFRDPLSYLLAMGAAISMAKHADSGGARPARAVAAGLLLGLACSVRETSVLLLAPFALYAFWSWRADGRIRFWRDALLFAAGLAAGLAPLMVQGLISTGQALLPPQSAVDHQLVPGAHFTSNCLRGTMERAWPYFLEMAGPGLLLLAWSAALGLWRRNRIIVGLLLPAALIHAVFYAFYWTFVPRYFYSVALFALPAVGWGLLATIWQAGAWAPPRFRTGLPAVAVTALAAGVAVHLLSSGPAGPRFQIPQARQFKADLEQRVPADSLVFCRRNLCEMVRWFTSARAFPATSLIPNDVPAEAALREALVPYLSDPRPLFLLEMRSGSDWEVDAALLNRICGLDSVDSLSADRYHLRDRTGARDLRLFRVRSSPPPAPILPDVEQARSSVARLDFALEAVPGANSALAGEVDSPTLARNTPRIRGPATVALPGPLKTGETAYAELRLRCPVRASGSMDVEVSIGQSFRTLRLLQDRAWHLFTLSAEGPLEQPALEFRAASPFDLHQVEWAIPQPSAHLKVDVGASGDFVHLGDGWHDREKTAGATARWTGPLAMLTWRCAFPGSPGRIALRHFAQNRPRDAPPPRIWCNEVELSADSALDLEAGCATVAANIPAGLLRADNVIRIEATGWQPGGSDPRVLGVFVDWISLDVESP